MKKLLLTTLSIATSTLMFAQGQIGNSDMEQWESVASGQEPVNWNSFLSGQGGFSGFASDQCQSSTDVRPGTSGSKSARIFSKSTLGIIANGNLTLGRINMGSATPSSPSNYNISLTADPNFSEALADHPDSIVFWAKFVPNGGNGNARMKATLHSAYDYRDPQDAGSAGAVVDTAVLNFPSTNNNWMRFAVPFTWGGGPAALMDQAYILVTFTTNQIPGGGAANDQLWIDDVELIYNANSISESNNMSVKVAMNNSTNTINVISEEALSGTYEVYNLMGQTVQTGDLKNEIKFIQPAGMYIVHVRHNGISKNFEIVRL